MDTTKLLFIAILVGFIGDLFVQLLVRHNVVNWGLKPYFQKFGIMESACLAAGIMGLFYGIWISLGLPLTWWALAIYGGVLNVLGYWLLPSLRDGYYKGSWIGTTVLGGIIPFVAPLLVARLLNV